MKLNGKEFYCPNSGVCFCAATGKKKPSEKCVSIAKKSNK
jgi:hypothetical protein